MIANLNGKKCHHCKYLFLQILYQNIFIFDFKKIIFRLSSKILSYVNFFSTMTVATHKCLLLANSIVLNEFSMQNNITDVNKHRMFSVCPVIKKKFCLI